MSEVDRTTITLAVLAGGAGARMGVPKGELRILGRPILEHLLHRLAWAGPTLLVTAPGRERPPGWEGFTREVADPVPGLGPLRGVLTALETAPPGAALVASVDMPEVGPEQLALLVRAAADRPEAGGIMLRRPGGIEPFPCLLRTALRDEIRTRLDTGRASVVALAHDGLAHIVDAPTGWTGAVWTNLNRPADLAAYAARPEPGVTPI